MKAKDVVVVGAGQGGLSAAIHLRLKGHRVLVLEASEQTGGKAAQIRRDGYRLDPGPSIIILTRIYEAVFRAAGRRMEDYLRFTRLDPFTRVYFEGRRPFDLPASREECLRVIREVSPEDAGAVDKVLGLIDQISPHVDRSIFARPIHKPWQLLQPDLAAIGVRFDPRKTYKQTIDEWFRSPVLRSFFYGFPSYGGQSFDSNAPGALMIPYLMIREGVWYPEGGVGAIPRAFTRLAEELGVEFRVGSRVRRMETSGRRIVAAILENGERIEAEVFVSNVDHTTTKSWIRNVPDQEPSLSYFTVHWGFAGSTEGLQHHTLLVPASFEDGFDQLYRRREFPAEPIVYLNETSGLDPASAPAGRSNLFAVVTSPAMEAGLDWQSSTPEFLRRVRNVMRKFDLEPREIDFEHIQTPLTFAQRDGNYKGSLYGLDERHRLFHLVPHGLLDEEYRNLFYCGGSVQPGAGLPMVTLSGKFVAELV
ncbi:MAG TPA: phytoene desaturase family protein [Fimbriimonas sp.]